MRFAFAGWAAGAAAVAMAAALSAVESSSGVGRVVSRQAPAPQATSQQPPSQPDQQRPTFRTEANLVRVDAFPTRDGAPVLDLGRDDFQVFEDGVPQTVDTFEHVVVRQAGPQAERREPNSQREGNEMAADPHNRVFVIFLDTYHVTIDGSHNIRRPLINMIDRILGPDDLVGVITPDMPASQLTLGRKTDVIEGGLTDTWYWGLREQINSPDPRERTYEWCYPAEQGRRRSTIAEAMIQRRREKITLDAVRDLVEHLNAVREERKAVITISEGWLLFTPSDGLALGGRPVPPQVLVSPRGTLTTRDERSPENATMSECDADRRMLGHLDDRQYFRDILRDAQRANTSFYPVDPRGLPVFDTSIGADPVGTESPTPASVDMAMLRTREESLRTIAVATDGIAVLGSNDIDKGLRKVVDGLNSYYLLGYYSTNTALDGKYRTIDVKVRRPGVEVRARRGYRAPSAAEIAAAADAPTLEVPTERAAVDAAIGQLSAIRHDTELSIAAVPLAQGGTPTLKIVGELAASVAHADAWREGGEVAVMVAGAGGMSLAATRARLAPGAWTFALDLPVSGAPPGTSCDVQVRLSPAGHTTTPVSAMTTATLPGTPPVLGLPLLFRRGPSTGAAYAPAADPRFLRTERVRLEAPLTADASNLAARVLDRTGQPIEVPVTVTERTGDGQRWLVADLNLAPLTNGDYLIEVTAAAAGKTERTLTGIRVGR